MEYAIKTENLTRSFQSASGTVTPISNLSMCLKKNEFLVVTGPSGSGKSTLVSLLSLMDKPSDGYVFVNGTNTSNLSERECAMLRGRDVALVNQSFNLLPNRTARENVTLPSYLHGIHLSSDFLNGLYSDLGIERHIDRPVIELSGGQKQRVAIARALSCKPSILIMDEPTGNLDQENTELFVELIKSIRQKAEVAVLLITHETSLRKIGDNLATLHSGELNYEA